MALQLWRARTGISSRWDFANVLPNQVYLVFVNDEGVAYTWRWEKADPDDLNLPQNHPQRFKKRLR